MNKNELVNPHRRARKLLAKAIGFRTMKAYKKWRKRRRKQERNTVKGGNNENI